MKLQNPMALVWQLQVLHSPFLPTQFHRTSVIRIWEKQHGCCLS